MQRTLIILNGTGDFRFEWDTEHPERAAEARQHFNDAQRSGHLAFAVESPDKPGMQISSFDEGRDAAEIIMNPQMVGG